MEKVSDPRNVELARRMWAAIQRFNRDSPRGETFKIDTGVMKILNHSPEYRAQGKGRGEAKTEHPSVLIVMDVARRLGVPVRELFEDQPPDTVTTLDREKLEGIARDLMTRAEWLRERFSLDGEAPPARTRPIAERPRGDESEINYPIGIRGEKPE